MKATYGQVRRLLELGSLIMFDRGANDKDNLNRIELDGNDYLMAKKLNSSDDAVFQSFSENGWERIDAEDGVYALKRTFPSRVNYYFFSERLKGEHLASRRRKAERLLAEARTIQESLDQGKRLPKRSLSRKVWITARNCPSGSASIIRWWTCGTITRLNWSEWTRRRRSASSLRT